MTYFSLVDYDNLEKIKIMIATSTLTKESILKENVYGRSYFWNAIYKGRVDIVKLFINTYNLQKEDIVVKLTPGGMTPLHVASQFGHTELVNFLITLCDQYDLRMIDNRNRTPLYWACWKGTLEIVKILTQAGIQKKDVMAKDDLGNTVIFIANLKNHVEIVKFLINTYDILKEDIMTSNKEGVTILHRAIENNNLNVIELLTNTYDIQKEDIMKIDRYGENAFLGAIENNNMDIVKLLMIKCNIRKDDIMKKDKYNKSMYSVATTSIRQFFDQTMFMKDIDNIINDMISPF